MFEGTGENIGVSLWVSSWKVEHYSCMSTERVKKPQQLNMSLEEQLKFLTN